MNNILTFKEWLLLKEEDNGIDPNTGQILDPQKYNNWKKNQTKQTKQPGKTLNDLYYEALKLVENWISQKDVKNMLITYMSKGGDVSKYPPFLNLMKSRNYNQQIIDKVGKQLANKIKYYYDSLPIANPA